MSAQLEKFAAQSGTLNAFLISPLLDLKAREALPVIARAYAGGHVDESVVGDYEDVEIELGLKTPRQHPLKPRPRYRGICADVSGLSGAAIVNRNVSKIFTCINDVRIGRIRNNVSGFYLKLNIFLVD